MNRRAFLQSVIAESTPNDQPGISLKLIRTFDEVRDLQERKDARRNEVLAVFGRKPLVEDR